MKQSSKRTSHKRSSDSNGTAVILPTHMNFFKNILVLDSTSISCEILRTQCRYNVTTYSRWCPHNDYYDSYFQRCVSDDAIPCATKNNLPLSLQFQVYTSKKASFQWLLQDDWGGLWIICDWPHGKLHGSSNTTMCITRIYPINLYSVVQYLYSPSATLIRRVIRKRCHLHCMHDIKVEIFIAERQAKLITIHVGHCKDAEVIMQIWVNLEKLLTYK